MWEDAAGFSPGSFEFMERKENSKDFVSVNVVAFVLQWKM